MPRPARRRDAREIKGRDAGAKLDAIVLAALEDVPPARRAALAIASR